MKSWKKYIVEIDGRAVYSSRSEARAFQVAAALAERNKECEILVHLGGIICIIYL